MLNVCMERRNLREGKLPFAMQLLTQQNASSSVGKTDSDDEFFDCDDDRVVDEEGKNVTTTKILCNIICLYLLHLIKNNLNNHHGIQSVGYRS